MPVGRHPVGGGADAPEHASRLDLAYARATGANFISDTARAAVRDRLAQPQPDEMLDENRLWADLLSSMPMCFNLLGDLHADLEAADRTVRAWWPDAPGTVAKMWFEWSPGRRDPAYLGNRTAFDAAMVLDLPDSTSGVIGIETKYHESPIRDQPPRDDRLRRYVEVSDDSRAFLPGALELIIGTPLQQIWLDHLLVLAMLQHAEAAWSWGRFVLVHPAGNVAYARLAEEYGLLLADSSTFEARTIESLIDAPAALRPATVSAFRDRYFWD